ncbi:thiolase family protein [Rhodovarius crocodyli]|uniref:propanoyl-CoA C-acyltransferase n=1 Tax=Rhodovarius crocodyli TaxID=1979269 RepID=A0A437MGG9_9PROT|nr:thiolase family protein [Rhodovarius crocodyli]RVT96741.1 thiolase family protein [Rhodovarius crocodyli]
MQQQCAVIGIGMTPFGKFMDRGIREMSEAAVAEALADAGVAATEIGHVYFANSAAGLITGQEMIRGQAALRFTGLAGKPVSNVENACASGSTALYHAWLAVSAGEIDLALVVGAEKLTHPDKTVSSQAFARAVDLEEKLPDHVGAGNGSIFMDIYAEKTRRYMAKTGATAEDFAGIVVKSRQAGARNPYAQFRTETTAEAVLGARMISNPLTLPMCSAIGDGASAIVLASAAAVRRLGSPKPVWIGGISVVSGLADLSLPNCAERCAQAVYERAGIGPQDVHVVELHDATAPAELLHYENLGLCGQGEAPALLRSGATGLGGRVSVNPSGGLLSRGHPIGATGAAQIVELTQQLRGTATGRQREGAKVALAENNGGQIGPDAAVGVATVLHV